MSTKDPNGDGGGGGTLTTSVVENVTPGTPSTDMAVLPGSQHSQHHQHPPPSPLSGCYLLVVLPEPHTAQHRDLILNRLAKGFLSWDKDSCHVDLEKELQALVAQAPEGEEARNGERLIQYATENLVTEVLIHPQTNTLLQCIRNLLASFTKHRHIIHAGYTFGGNGSWILQDGTFSLADFLDAFSEHEVQRVLRAYENSVTVDINCAGVGEWSNARLSREACTRSCRVRLNPDDVLTAGVPAITSFTNYVGQYLVPQTLDQLMEPSDVVGNIRFSHPTLYVFPGGQGDAALFGINGFNMLVDGGFARKACFWDFARHLDRLDAVLVTRINNSNVGGMSSVLRKKREMHVYPQIGHFFSNLVERRHSNSPDGDKDLDPLILNLTDIGQEMMVNLREINLRAHPCYRDPNPINLYHKVGHGTLDMYVLSPSKDSREVREFISKWHSSDSKLFAGSHRKDSNNLTFPIQNLASICALLVWQPANPEDTITRILFPGSTPQHKIFEGFERLKHLDFLKHPVCTAKSLSPSNSLLALKDRPTMKQKLALIESKETKKISESKLKDKRDLTDSPSKPVAPAQSPIIPTSKAPPIKVDVKTKKVVENKKIETEQNIGKESKKIERDLREMRKDKESMKIKSDETKKLDGMRTKMDVENKPVTKESRAIKPEPKKKESKETKESKPPPPPVSKIVSKIEVAGSTKAKLAEKKISKATAEKKDSPKASPPTPKKTMANNGTASKIEIAKTSTPKPISKPAAKLSSAPSVMPAKSAKDANNRKVVEQKNIEIASSASSGLGGASAAPKKPSKATTERKPISRRSKPVSPSKSRLSGSPVKSTRSTPTTSVKSDKDGVIRRVNKGDRGTTDSSTVSTPSGIEIDSMSKLAGADKSLTEKSEDMSLDSIESKVLADLKEEREVVEEIEAVLQKAERIEEARKDDHLEGDDDITAEAIDKKDDDMTEDDVTADIDEGATKIKESSRKPSQELTEEDEYLIVEKEEIYIEDSVQSGEGEQKHLLDAVESEKVKRLEDTDKETDEEVSEEKEKTDVPEKKFGSEKEIDDKEKEADDMEQFGSQTEPPHLLQKALTTEEKDDSGKKDSEDMTKEPSSLSPDKFDSSEKKTTDTDIKPEIDQKDQAGVPADKLEESQERISTLESGATTTAPTLPEDERIPLDEIKEVIDEKHTAPEEDNKTSLEVKESSPALATTAEPKPEVKPSFEVRPPLQGIQREIVKTPDEVADLPVHEEVDPKLYQVDDFEKAKDDKPLTAAGIGGSEPVEPTNETKAEPPTPPIKEQKGVFSFFGKVADKFEKGMDKLTGKGRRDSEKDVDEKSSASKSSSPKETKSRETAFPGETQAEEITEKFAKIGSQQKPENVQAFEKAEPEASKVKIAAIKETAAFLHGEIDQVRKSSISHILPSEGEKEVSEPVFETCVIKGESKKSAEVEEDVEDVEALLEEASKKFKTVKDSLRDSLESLEEKMVEEEMVRAELAVASKDVVKDTLFEVVGKLEEIKPHMDEQASTMSTSEQEKVKFDIKNVDDDSEKQMEDSAGGVMKDFKEAMRDVGEVLAGSAGILIEEKPKDVVGIVKKVAEVLKKDDFLSHDVIYDGTDKIDDESKSSAKLIDTMMIMPTKVGITEELPAQEETEEILEAEITMPLEIHEEICVKASADEGSSDVKSPVKPSLSGTDKAVAMKLCADLMEDEISPTRTKRSVLDDVTDHQKQDVMDTGIESVYVKEEVKHQVSEEDVYQPRDDDTEPCDIVFDHKVSPGKAEMIMMTPDSAPTSPKFTIDKSYSTTIIHEETPQLSADIKNLLEKHDMPLENVIEDLVFARKTKITIEIVEYIVVIRRIPREKVIHIIEEISHKKGVSRDSVVADSNLFESDEISNEKRLEIEQYIQQEYVSKNKKITMEIVEEICVKKIVSRRIVMEIIEEIIIKQNIPRDDVVDISDQALSSPFNIIHQESCKEEESLNIATSTVQHDKHSEIKRYIVDEIISIGKKITPQLIDSVCNAKRISRKIFVNIITEIIVERKMERSSIFDISEKELSELLDSEKEEMDKEVVEEKDEKIDNLISLKTRQEIEKNIIDEYVAKNRRITPYVFEDICLRNKVPRSLIVHIIEEVIVKLKVPRSSVLNISDNELEELLGVEKEQEIETETATSVERAEEKVEEEEGCEEEELPKIDAKRKKSASPETRSKIECSIIEEFILKGKRITPYIFEDLCVRYKVPRRIVIEIIEEIIVKRKVRRGSVLDITETELSELLFAVEAGNEEEQQEDEEEEQEENRVDNALLPSKVLVSEDAEEDKLVDGFVSIPSKDDSVIDTVSKISSKTKESTTATGIESEKDIVDDFEAVEQEYKISGIPISSVTESAISTPSLVVKSEYEKLTGDIEEAIEDDVSDVIEADEKIIPPENTLKDETQVLDIVDTVEKYLIEGQEKSHINEQVEQKASESTRESTQDLKMQVEKTVAEPQIIAPKDVEELIEKKKPEDIIGIDTVVSSTVVSKKETTEVDVLREKCSTDEGASLRRDSLEYEESDAMAVKTKTVSANDEGLSGDIDDADDSAVPTVRRMVITASSEDGGHEIEVCPTGSITFTKSTTPDDSLKCSPVKTTPDQDSLLLDKESLHSGTSTPGEKDSISGKSTPGIKEGDKITPQDSLDKSPLGTRDSQDLEDSLEKSDPTKLKEVETAKDLSTVIEKAATRTSITDLEPTSENVVGDIKSSVLPKAIDAHTLASESEIPSLPDEKPTPGVISRVATDKEIKEGTEIISAEVDTKEIDNVRKSFTISLGFADDEDGSVKKTSSDVSDDVDQSKFPSTTTVIPRSRSSSVASQKHTDIEHTDESLPIDETISHEEHDIKRRDSLIKKRLPSATMGSENEQIERPDEKDASELQSKSSSPSTGREVQDERSPIERSKSPTNQLVDGTKTCADEDVIDGAKLLRISDDKHSAKESEESIESCKLSSPDTVEIGDKTLTDRSKTSSIAIDELNERDIIKITDTESVHSSSPSLVSEKVAGEKHTEKEISKLDDEPRKPSIVDEISGSASVADDQITDMDHQEPNIQITSITDTFKSPIDKDIGHMDNQPKVSVSEEHIDSQVSVHETDKSDDVYHAKSVNIAEHRKSEVVGKSKSPSIADAKDDEKDSIGRSRSSSIATDIKTENIAEVADKSISPSSSVVSDKETLNLTDKSRTPSIIGNTPTEADVLRLDGKTRSSNIESEKHDEKSAVDPSKSTSVVDEAHSEIKSRSASIASDKSSVYERMELKDDEYKLPSIASEKLDEKRYIDHSESPIDAHEKPVEKDVLQSKSRSPSIVNEKPTEDPSQIVGDNYGKTELAELKSISDGIVSEKLDDKELIDHSKSPSLDDKNDSDKNVPDLQSKARSSSVIGEMPADQTKPSSIASDKHSEIDHIELADERSRSASIVSEKPDDKVHIDGLKSPSSVDEKDSEKDVLEKQSKSRPSSVLGEQLADRSKSPSIASDKHSEIDHMELTDHKSRSASITSEKPDDIVHIDGSKSPSTGDEKDSEKHETQIRSRSSSIASYKHSEIEHMEPTDDVSRSTSIASEKPDDKVHIDGSKSPRIVDENDSKNDVAEAQSRSRSPSVVSDKSADLSKSSSIAGDKHSKLDHMESTDSKSRSASIAGEKPDDKMNIHSSRSPSVVDKKDSEKDITEAQSKSRSSSIVDRKDNDVSKSPAIADGKHGETEHSEQADVKSRSASIASEKLDDTVYIDGSQSHNIVDEKNSENDLPAMQIKFGSSISGDKRSESEQMETADSKSRSASITSEKPDDKVHIDSSKSPSIVDETDNEKDVPEPHGKSRSSSVISEKPADQSKSPSITGDTHSEIAHMEFTDGKSRSPSIASEKPDDNVHIDGSKSPSIVDEKDNEKDVPEAQSKSRSSSVISEKPADQSKSPSIAGEKHTEIDHIEIRKGESRSASIASEKPDDKLHTDGSKSPSIVDEKDNEKDLPEVQSKSRSSSVTSEKPADQFKSPSIAGDKHTNFDHIQIKKGESTSASIASEKPDDKLHTDGSKSPSIVDEKDNEKDFPEGQSKSRSSSVTSEKPADQFKSSSIAGDKHSEIDHMELTDSKPRSASIASEKPYDKVHSDESKPPSIVDEKDSEKDVPESHGKSRSSSVIGEKPADRSKSPSIAGDEHSEIHHMELTDGKSRSASIASEKPDDKVHTDGSKSSSIVDEKDNEKYVPESHGKSRSSSIIGDKPADRSKSPSIAGDKPSEIHHMELTDGRSRSSSIASEKLDDKVHIDGSKSPSIVDEKDNEKDVLESHGKSRSPSIIGDKPADRSKSPSIAGDKPSEIHHMELTDGKSRSSSIASEKPDDKVRIDGSKSPSIVDEKDNEKDVLDSHGKSRSPSIIGDKPADRSKSPSIAGDKPSEIHHMELTDGKSRSSSIASEKPDDKVRIDGSKSPSIVDEKDDEKDIPESHGKSRSSSIISDKPDDRSKSHSIAGDKHSEIHHMELTDGKSRSTSIASEKPDDKVHTDESKPSSTVDENESEKDVPEPHGKSRSSSVIGDKPAERSKSPSIAGDQHSEIHHMELTDGKSRSTSIASEKPDDKVHTDESKPSSTVDENESEKDVPEPHGKSRSSSVIGEKPAERSKSPSIAGDQHSEIDHMELTDSKHGSASIASEKPDNKVQTDESKPPSIVDEKDSEKDVIEPHGKSRSSSVIGEKPADQSKLPSIADDTHSEISHMELTDGKPRSASIASEKPDDKIHIDGSKSPGIVDEKDSRKDVPELQIKSRSSSVIGENPDDRSKSPSIAGDKHSEIGLIELTDSKSRSGSIASEKTDDKVHTEGSNTPSIVDEKDNEEDVPAAQSKSKSSSVIGEKPADKSKAPSIVGDKHSEIDNVEPTDGKSRSASITSEKLYEMSHIDASKRPSIFHEKNDEKDVSDSQIKSRSPSITGEKHSELDHLESSDVKSRSDSIGSDYLDNKGRGDDLKSPSIADEEHSNKGVAEAQNKSRSSSIVGDRHVDPNYTAVDKSSLSSIVSESPSNEAIADHSKPPGIVDEKHDEKGIAEVPPSVTSELLDTGSFKTLKSPSIAGDKPSEVDITESHDGQRSDNKYDDVQIKGVIGTSFGEIGERSDDVLPTQKSRSSSIQSETIELEHESTGGHEKHMDGITSASGIHAHEIEEKYMDKRKDSVSSIASERDAVQVLQQWAEITDDCSAEKSLHGTPKDRSRSHSLFDTGEKTPLGRSRTASLYDDKVPEVLSLLGDARTAVQLYGPPYAYDESDETKLDKDDISRKSSSPDISHFRRDVGLEEENFPSISTDFETRSGPSNVSADGQLGKEPIISDQQRVQIETYVMEECVKKGRKITILVLEQIMTKMAVSRSILLDIIENIIVTRKMSRKTMVDDAIYDDIESSTIKSAEYHPTTRGQLVEGSGKSTPDPKSSGYSTPEVRSYDEKFSKDMPSYSSDYESPFHKAFVGGMTEIRTTHITTLSGKSTPDFGMRDEILESLSDSMTSSSQPRTEEKLPSDKASPPPPPHTTSGTIFTETSGQTESISAATAPVAVTTCATTVSSAKLDSVVESKDHGISVTGDKGTSADAFADDRHKIVKQQIEKSQVQEDNQAAMTRTTITSEICEEKDPKILTSRVRREVIEDDEEPEVITRIIRREIIHRDVDDDGDENFGASEEAPEVITQTITRTTKTILTEEPEFSTSSSVSDSKCSAGGTSIADVEKITTITTAVTESDSSVTSKMDKIQQGTETLKEEDKSLRKSEKEHESVITMITSQPSGISKTGCIESAEALGKQHTDKLMSEKWEQPISQVIKDLISDERSYSDGSMSKSTPDIPPASPYSNHGASGHSQMSGRSTPDKRPDSRSSTATPEGFRSSEVIRTTITTTREMSEEGDIITTTKEITESTNDRGETTILAEKTDVKVEDRVPPNMVESASPIGGFDSVKASTELSSEKDLGAVSPRSDQSSVHSRVGTHVWESSEERHAYSDDELPGSPLSTTSQVGYSPQSTYHFGEQSYGKDSPHKSIEFSEADMSSSFYGELPDLPPRATTIKTTYMMESSSSGDASGASDARAPSTGDFSFKKPFAAEQLPGGYIEKTTGGEVKQNVYDSRPELQSKETTLTKEQHSSSLEKSTNGNTGKQTSSTDDTKKKDPLAGWDTPLGLPSPKPPRKFNLRTISKPANNSTDISPDSLNFDAISDWGEPLRLPSPAPIADEASNKGAPLTPKKERKQPKKVITENMKNRKRSESPSKNDKKTKDSKNKIQPVYVDLTYVPHHGNSYYTSLEFFKRIRARYYVFSGTEPSREVYDALLDAKKSWEDKDLEVTMIPTYDTDTLGYWVADNEEALAANHIDLSPSASRCTINLQDHETSCSAYRLEF